MAKLSEGQKAFVVTRLACMYSPSEVVEAVKEEFGVQIPRQQVAFYDPTTLHGGRELSAELKALFEDTRARFITDVQSVPVANQAYRLRKIQDLLDHNRRNPAMTASLLEQAAKEVGGMFTNRREVTGANGGPVQVEQRTDLSGLSTDELYELRRLREKIGAPAQPPRN